MAERRNWRNLVSVRPDDVQPDDAFAVKIVAVVDSARVYWAAYRGSSDWSDERVAAFGDKILEEQARAAFHVLDVSGIPYRS